MAIPAQLVANYLLAKSREAGTPLTPMKLQKLVYLCQGWFAAINGGRLINEEAQAWDWGPVYSSLYHNYKRYGSSQIDSETVSKPTLDQLHSELIDGVWSKYSPFSAYQLSDMTHKPGTPWSEARQRGIKGAIVPFDKIKQHFLELKDQYEKSVSES